MTTIDERSNDHYVVNVKGTSSYTVHITLSTQGWIKELTCDCPYDMDDYCKHQIAALYALQQHKEEHIVENLQNRVNPETADSDLKQALNKLGKAELVDIVVNLADDYEDVENKLQYIFIEDENDLEISKKLIRDYINRNKRQGFIHYRDVYDALKGVFMTLEKAETKLASGKTELAVDLSLASLSAVANMVNYSDDSDGYIGDVVSQSKDIVDQAVKVAMAKNDDHLKSSILDRTIKEAQKKRYDDWSEWRYDLYMICVPLADHKKRRDKLEKSLDKHLQSINIESWTGEREIVEIKEIQYQLIVKLEDEESANQFINDHLQYHQFREKAVQYCIVAEDYDQALQLCKTGMEQDKELRGIINKWKNYEFLIYEELGDIEKQRELARDFVLANEFSYYAKLKSLYDDTEWPPVLKDLLEGMDQDRYFSNAYLDILKTENMKDRILDYCRQHLSSIIDLYPFLIDDYPDEVEKMFGAFIEQSAAEGSNRKAYRKTAKLIKIFKKVCGSEPSDALINDLMTVYNRRPAMLDELGKIK